MYLANRTHHTGLSPGRYIRQCIMIETRLSSSRLRFCHGGMRSLFYSISKVFLIGLFANLLEMLQALGSAPRLNSTASSTQVIGGNEAHCVKHDLHESSIPGDGLPSASINAQRKTRGTGIDGRMWNCGDVYARRSWNGNGAIVCKRGLYIPHFL